jgi:hypothetical protein
MATVTKPIALDESFHTSDGNNTNIADILLRLVNATGGCGYEIELPTTGYTSGTFTIWGESFTGYSITITTDHNGNPLTNFTSGMTEDYPINVSGSQTDFNKLYAFSIGNGNVTFYLTSAPSTAFNVLIKEAI